jgi:hypothetical protein
MRSIAAKPNLSSNRPRGARSTDRRTKAAAWIAAPNTHKSVMTAAQSPRAAADGLTYLRECRPQDGVLISDDGLDPAIHMEHFRKEIAMNQRSTDMTTTDEFEFTAGYGTAIIMRRAGTASSAHNEDWRIAEDGSRMEQDDFSVHAGIRSRAVHR